MSAIQWSAAQAAAIVENRHSLLVANAGTGKTATVIAKVRWLLGLRLEAARSELSDNGVPIEPCTRPCELREIAAITFTEKAAYDLKHKLREAIIGSERADELRWQIDRASIGTIHAFCGDLLREHALRLGIDPTFRVLDAREAWTDQDDVVHGVILSALAAGDEGASRLLAEFKLRGYTHTSGVIDHVRRTMNDMRWHADRYAAWSRGDDLDIEVLRTLSDAWDDDLDGTCALHAQALVSLARRALDAWQAYLLEENAKDFDALILDARTLLTGPDGAAALESIRRRYRILIIDEFQDTDRAQRDIAFAICGLDAPRRTPTTKAAPRPQLFLVGDPKQSIYRFRGADIAVWNEVQEVLGACGKIHTLRENYRCAPPIVDFVNDAVSSAMEETGEALAVELAGSRIPYQELVAAVPDSPGAGLEWLVAQQSSGRGSAREDKRQEALHVAARIHEMVAGQEIVDRDTGLARPLAFRDIAVLYRSHAVLQEFDDALRAANVPYAIAGSPHLGDRQEILDLLNVIRLLRNPRDDYRAFGYLRSPFVSLRDEVIVYIASEVTGRSLLHKAARFLERDAWFEAPEGAAVTAIERRALARGLDTLRRARARVHGAPLDEVLAFVIDALGYRMHLLLRGRAEEPLANIQTFLQFTEEYRDLDVATFLEVWERWDEQDNGLPQAPLYSNDDDVVTLSTIHRAKGLEWPVVFLVGTGARAVDMSTHRFWSDPELGPILCPRTDERGVWAQRVWRRNSLEDRAEETRLLYVASTRARDRLVIVGPRDRERSYSAWLARGVHGNPFHIRDAVPAAPPQKPRARPSLAWLADIGPVEVPDQVRPAAEPVPRFVVSATELMARAQDPEIWRLRYRHGVQPVAEFAKPRSGSDTGAQIPATVRGSVIHEVLERIRAEDELARLLQESIGGLDDPELETLLSESSYREMIEEEIRRVVRSDEWAWYTRGEHYRELAFLHLHEPRAWRIGAFDLYRPDDPAWVIDFKTHEIAASDVRETARDYAIQIEVYRSAAALRSRARVGLHFTGPNQMIEIAPPEP